MINLRPIKKNMFCVYGQLTLQQTLIFRKWYKGNVSYKNTTNFDKHCLYTDRPKLVRVTKIS